MTYPQRSEIEAELRSCRTPVIFSITEPAHTVLGIVGEEENGQLILTFIDPGRRYQMQVWSSKQKTMIYNPKYQVFSPANKAKFEKIFRQFHIKIRYGTWEKEFGDSGHNGFGPLLQGEHTCAITSIIASIFLLFNHFQRGRKGANAASHFDEGLLRQMWCGLKKRAAAQRPINPRMYTSLDSLVTAIIYNDEDKI